MKMGFGRKKLLKILLEGIGGWVRGGENVLVPSSVLYNGVVKKLTITAIARMGGKPEGKV
jgi:hypothetical protein